MKKILLISPYWKEEHRWMVSSFKLAELWQRMGYHVTAVCMGSETKIDEVSDTLTVHYRKDYFIPDPFNYGIALGFSGYVCRLAKEIQPDLIIVNKVLFWTSLSLLRLQIAGHKVLLLTDVLGGMTWWPRSLLTKVCMALLGWCIGWPVMLASSKMVTFHPQPDRLLSFLGIRKKVRVIPTGIDASLYAKAERGESATITYVGRLESVKGVDDFLAAVVPLQKEFPSLTIQVVGWYKDDHPLVEQYQRDVVFTGLRKDIPDILAKSDIFVLPSYSEGLSNALMEAMSSSCACIATDVGGNRYLLQSGTSGFFFQPGDREALKAQVRKLLEDPVKRTKMGDAARKRIQEVFDWNVVQKQYKELFCEIHG